MSRIYVQKTNVILNSAASLVASGSIAGSALCDGFTSIIGGIITSASGELVIEQSLDKGSNYDFVSASVDLSACTAASRSDAVIGNVTKIIYRNGDDDADEFRINFGLRPI